MSLCSVLSVHGEEIGRWPRDVRYLPRWMATSLSTPTRQNTHLKYTQRTSYGSDDILDPGGLSSNRGSVTLILIILIEQITSRLVTSV